MGSQAGVFERRIFLHKIVEFKNIRSIYNNIYCLEQDEIIRKETLALA
jgi:hypothetical protein